VPHCLGFFEQYEVYVKVVESTVGKRGSKSAVSKDYNKCIFKGTAENAGDFISKAICIPEYPYRDCEMVRAVI
jgi:hypothetical protein